MLAALAVLFALAAFLIWFVVKSDRGAKEPLAALAVAFGFGLLAIGLALLAEKRFISADFLVRFKARDISLAQLLGLSFLVAGVEELAKFVPLAWFVRKKKYFNEHSDGLIYFAASGVAFGLVENIVYLINIGPKITLLRAVVLLFFHPASSAVVGYFFARHRVDKQPIFYTLLVLAGVTVLHAVYNFGIGLQNLPGLSISLTVTALLNTCLFLFYRMATENDQAEGLSASGENEFCRHCGAPNPKHYLYCEHCGNQA